MDTATHDDDPRLDGLLDRSAPPTMLAAQADGQALHQMALAARGEARPVRWPRTARRTAGFAAALGLGLGGVGVAAAAVTGVDLPWSPWAQEPDATLTYTLPSGAVCEQRLGNVESSDQARVEALQEYVSTHDVLALADVDGAITQMRTEERTFEGHRAEYPSEYYPSPDSEYQQAVSQAVAHLVFGELERRGFGPDTDLSLMGEAHCPGAKW
ncbi:hypothetical protein ACGIF2_04040 [Cellulomonas sp. P22]|uniref:hypothetical protein n=1 Tax=Cellulomonas sp. P22 TaxID=3373189 RepID=UPI0037A0F98F